MSWGSIVKVISRRSRDSVLGSRIKDWITLSAISPTLRQRMHRHVILTAPALFGRTHRPRTIKMTQVTASAARCMQNYVFRFTLFWLRKTNSGHGMPAIEDLSGESAKA